MALAIFDLDLTLIGDDSDHQWGEFLVEKNLVDAELYAQKNNQFYADYQSGKLDIDAYLQFSLNVLTQYSTEQLYQWREEFIRTQIVPLILPKSKALVEQHRAQGDTLLIITATNYFVSEPIAKLFAIEHLIAPMPEIKNGVYTGKVVGVPSFQVGKISRLQDWLKSHPHGIEEAFFYSDSSNDLPLLEMVGNPVTVNPDAKLKRTAQAKKWPILQTLENS